jgi:hypothetical protein
MKAIVPVGGLVVAIIAGVAGYGLGGKRGSCPGKHQPPSDQVGSSTSDPAQTEDVDGLRRQVAELERKLGVLTAHVATQKPDGAGAEEPRPATHEPVPFEEQVERDKVAWEKHIASVAAAFQAERRDPAWAGSTTSLLRARAGSDKVIGPTVKDIDCRSKTCRVELVDDQKGEFARKLPDFLKEVSNVFPMGQARTVDNPDGTKTLSVYLSTVAPSDDPGSPGG